jgi:hypothetical protein
VGGEREREREREREKNKTNILRVRSKRKKETFIKKKIWICERRLFHLFQKIIFLGLVRVQNPYNSRFQISML